MRPTIVKQIRRYHGVVVHADKTIADAGRKQIRAAYNCGLLLAQQRAKCQSNGWGKWCKKHIPEISKSTIGRYILLTEVSDLTHLETKYRTLNAAYVGEEITSAPRQRITIKTVTPAEPVERAVVPKYQDRKGKSLAQNDGRNRCGIESGSTEIAAKPIDGDGNGDNGIDLKAKVRGGGNLGYLMGKVSPSARAQIQSQLHQAANGGEVQTAEASTVAPVEGDGGGTTPKARLIDPLELGGEAIAGLFQGPLLIDALLLQLKQCAESHNPTQIYGCVSSLKPIVIWYEEHAAKAEALVA